MIAEAISRKSERLENAYGQERAHHVESDSYSPLVRLVEATDAAPGPTHGETQEELEMKKRFIAIAAALVLFVAALSPSKALFDKTRFVADLGMAFYAFHHWVWNPYKAGSFQSGAPHRTKSLVKGGLALLFAVNRVKAANRIAHTSKSPLLHKLASSLDAMQDKFSSVGQRLKGGQFDQKSIEDVNDTVSDVGSGAAQAGAPVHDVPVAIPGT